MDKMIPDRKTYDTFKTHYVYVVCAVLGLITNIIQGFDIIDVSPHPIIFILSFLTRYHYIVLLDFFNLLRIRCHLTPTNDAHQHERSRESHEPIHILAGTVPRIVYPELGVQVVPRDLLQAQLGRLLLRNTPNLLVFRFFLLFFYQ